MECRPATLGGRVVDAARQDTAAGGVPVNPLCGLKVKKLLVLFSVSDQGDGKLQSVFLNTEDMHTLWLESRVCLEYLLSHAFNSHKVHVQI